jgi:LL-diaminopimelate aminotransferase
MTVKLSARMEKSEEYIHARLARLAADVETRTGKKVLRFGAGSPDVPPSDKYIEKLTEFLRDKDAHLYPGYDGIPEFISAVQVYYKRRFGVELEKDEITPLLGAKDGIAHLPMAMIDAGDEFLVPDPGYPAFVEPAVMMGGKPVTYDLLPEKDFKVDIAQLRSKVTSRTKYAWINFPSNPTGQVATLDDAQSFVAFSKETNVPIIYDNCYAEIAFDGFIPPSIFQVPGAKDTCVELGSFSKAFSFAGNRMGWLVGNREIIAAVSKVKSQMDSGMWLPLQHLGAYALTNTDIEWHTKMIESYKTRRDIIAEKFRGLGCKVEIPKAALYLWAKIPDSATNSEEFTLDLLNKKHILVTPGSAFGQNGARYIRISYCVNIENIEQYF